MMTHYVREHTLMPLTMTKMTTASMTLLTRTPTMYHATDNENSDNYADDDNAGGGVRLVVGFAPSGCEFGIRILPWEGLFGEG